MPEEKLQKILKALLLMVIPLNVLADAGATYLGPGGFSSYLRAAFLFSFILAVLLLKRNLPAPARLLLAFSLYLLILLPFSSNFTHSLRQIAQVLASMWLLPAAYLLIGQRTDLRRLNYSLLAGLALFLAAFAAANLFGSGALIYEKKEGLLFQVSSGSGLNVLSYGLVLAPLVLAGLRGRRQRLAAVLLYLACFLLLFISLRRVAFLAVILGWLLYGLFSGRWRQVLEAGLLALLFLALGFPLYRDTLEKRFLARTKRVSLEKLLLEPRIRETWPVWSRVWSFADPLQSLFGLEPFNSRGRYGKPGQFGKRILHVDYNTLLFTTGICGLLLYLAFMFDLWRRRPLRGPPPGDFFHRDLPAIYLTLLLVSLFTSISGQMYALSFRSIIFLYLGALLGLVYRRGQNRAPAELE